MNSPQRYLNVCIRRRGKMSPSEKKKSNLISYQSQNSEKTCLFPQKEGKRSKNRLKVARQSEPSSEPMEGRDNPEHHIRQMASTCKRTDPHTKKT